ncbi:MAG: coiled-coil domain-containing protein [Bacillota bacterium]
MPKINRIRVVNFSYNNDSRHILDETFNFYGGENALLNLANGGGKSVLVQLFLQPVVPGAKIQGRSIAAFFRKKKLPVYVMIEWKLDGAGGYLLTGIGIVPVEMQGAEGEEKSRVKYFTFTSNYSHANIFDLAKIPLVKRNGSLLEVMPFREARETMAERERRDPLLFGYFSEEEADRYAKRLAEFGISQDEWKNVVARINDSEGGLEEIFQKCKNSGQLLNEWVIKTVEKAMFRDKAEARRLGEMLDSLVKEVVENERFIVEKQLLDGFISEFKGQADLLDGLLKGLEDQQKLSGKFSAMQLYLNSQTGALQEQLGTNKQEFDNCLAEERHVLLEERSYDLILKKTAFESALDALGKVEKDVTETDLFLSDARLRELIMRAARIAGEIHQKECDLSGIEEKLSSVREKLDTDTRVNSLEYSLKIRYAEYLETIAGELERKSGEKVEKDNALINSREELKTIDGEKSELDAQWGRLEERKKHFEENERDVKGRLGLIPRRNLLGELDAVEVQKFRMSLEHNCRDLETESGSLKEDKTAITERLKKIEYESKELQVDREGQRLALNDVSRDIEEYEQKEEEIRGILARYGFDYGIRFDQERLRSAFAQLVRSLEERKEEAAHARDEAGESLHSIKQGSLHAPERFATLLAELDIQYETGEMYLRNQPGEIRGKLLEANPVLPYAFIMSRDDIGRLANSVSRLTVRQAIPLVAHEDLGKAVEHTGRVARINNGLSLTCFYEGRMFDSESLARLLAELEKERSDAQEKYDHFSEVNNAAVSDSSVCERFGYAADYRYILGKKKDECQARLRDMENRAAALVGEKGDLRKKLDEIEENLGQLRQAHAEAVERVTVFTKFIEREKDFQDCRTKLSAVKQKIVGMEHRKVELTASMESLRQDVFDLNQDIQRKKEEQEATLIRYSLYKNAPLAEMIEGSAGELEERLRSLKVYYSGEIGPLEQRKKELVSDCNSRRKELKKLGIEEEKYAGVLYDELAEIRNREEINRLELILRERQDAKVSAATKKGAAEQAQADALKEVHRLGAEEPLPPEEIKGDFEERRRKARRRVQELNALNESLSAQISGYRVLAEKIRQLVDIAATLPDQGFVPERDLNAQLAAMEKDFRILERANRQAEDDLRRGYASHQTRYRNKNLNIDNIFKGLDPLWEKPGMGYAEYYYLFERTSQHLEKLADLIKIYEIQLANLEQDKKDMVQQSFLHGLRVYEEIRWISENSKVRLQGRVRPVQMLRIDLQLDNNDAAMLRVKEYVEACISQVREETRQEKREDEVRKLAVKLMSSREMLDVFLGTRHIPVSVFKVDLNAQNSRLKLWEDAVRENSGGEKFVVFFTVLAALMAYTRARTMEAAGAEADTDTRVLVMDNPFGPISSEHLLNPLFEIARKYRTQLICLSDLKQNSIMNCFNLIFMLKVRTSAIGNNEYLKIEEVIRDESEIQHDEKLEKAIFRASDLKQVSLFEEM